MRSNKYIVVFVALVFMNSLFGANKPSWLTDISKGCKERSELCAVGEGVSRKKAEANAKAALAGIFQSKVSSKYKSMVSAAGSSVKRESTKEVEVKTDELAIEGVKIKKQYEDKTSFYALAVINKRKVSEGFKREIKKLDEKMEVYVNESKGSTVIKLEKAFLTREGLAQSYHFLTGREIPRVVTFEQVFRNKEDIVGNIIIHVYLDEDEPKAVEGLVAKLLSKAGYKVTTGRVRNKNSTHIVSGELVADKQYMNVEGFEKYKLSLKLSAKDVSKVETGHLNFEVTETGRNFAQAYAKAEGEIKTYLKENLTKLNIE